MKDDATGNAPGSGHRGEKIGWLGGWLGGFLWVLILSVIRLVQGRTGEGFCGLGLFLVAVGAIYFLAPWRHPSTRQWKLMIPVYLALFASVAWAVWTSGGLAQLGLTPWSFFGVLPCFIPLWTVGGRRWGKEHEGSLRMESDERPPKSG